MRKGKGIAAHEVHKATLTSVLMRSALNESLAADLSRFITSSREDVGGLFSASRRFLTSAVKISLTDTLFFPPTPPPELAIARFARNGAVKDNIADDAAAFSGSSLCFETDDDNDDDVTAAAIEAASKGEENCSDDDDNDGASVSFAVSRAL